MLPGNTEFFPRKTRNHLLQQYTLSEQDGEYLARKAKELIAKSRVDRAKFIGNAMDHVLESYPTIKKDERMIKKKGIRVYFHRYGRKKKSREIFARVRKWSLKSVLSKTHKVQLEKILSERSGGARPGSKEYFAHFQDGLKSLIEGLSKEELEVAKLRADEWTLDAPPRDIQMKHASRKVHTWCERFTENMARQLGVYAVVVVGRLTSSGNTDVFVYDPAHDLGIESVCDKFPSSKDMGLVANMWEHVDDIWGDQGIGLPEKGKKKRKGKPTAFNIKVTKDGIILPPRNPDLRLSDKKQLVREIGNACYSFCSGQKGQVPWLSLSKDSDRSLVPAECVPAAKEIDGVLYEFYLNDPTRMAKEQVNALLEHWYNADTSIPLKFNIECAGSYQTPETDAWDSEEENSDEDTDFGYFSDFGDLNNTEKPRKRVAGKAKGTRKTSQGKKRNKDSRQAGSDQVSSADLVTAHSSASARSKSGSQKARSQRGTSKPTTGSRSNVRHMPSDEECSTEEVRELPKRLSMGGRRIIHDSESGASDEDTGTASSPQEMPTPTEKQVKPKPKPKYKGKADGTDKKLSSEGRSRAATSSAKDPGLQPDSDSPRGDLAPAVEKSRHMANTKTLDQHLAPSLPKDADSHECETSADLAQPETESPPDKPAPTPKPKLKSTPRAKKEASHQIIGKKRVPNKDLQQSSKRRRVEGPEERGSGARTHGNPVAAVAMRYPTLYM